MKKYKLIILSLIMMIISIIPLHAASFGLSSSTKQVSPNGGFTISVGGDCIGKVNLSITNGTLSTSSVWVEQGYTTVNVTAGSSGQVTITATPVTGFSDPDANIYNPGSRSITVTIASPGQTVTTPTRPSTQTPTIKKSNDNNLSSLTVKSGELSPDFNSSQTEYSLNLPANTTNLIIEATPSDSKAKVDGIGEKTLTPGTNNIEIAVTAEDGSIKKYIIKAYVDETPQVYLEYKKEKIGIIRNYEGVTIPENFIKNDYAINEEPVVYFNNESLNIIYGLNEKNEKNFYLFDKEKNQIISKFAIVNINNDIIFITDKEISNNKLEQDTININDTLVSCYKLKDKNYYILNTINKEGKDVEYLYESSENKIILFPKFLLETNSSNIKNILIYSLTSLSIILIGVIAFLLIKLKKGDTHEKTK